MDDRKYEVEVYSFSSYDAKKYGVDAAIFINRLRFLLQLNKDKKYNYKDGKYWTYNTLEEINEIFFFWSERKLQRIVSKLQKDKVILVEQPKGNNRTNHYTLSDDYWDSYLKKDLERTSPSGGDSKSMTTKCRDQDSMTTKCRVPRRQNGVIHDDKMAPSSLYNKDNNKDSMETQEGCVASIYDCVKLLWNRINEEHGKPLANITDMTPKRKSKVKNLTKKFFKTEKDWENYFYDIHSRPYLVGKVKDWICTFNWILEHERVVEILEGKFKDEKQNNIKQLFKGNPYRDQR